MLRHCATTQFTLWMVTQERFKVVLSIISEGNELFKQTLTEQEIAQVQVGERAFINLIDVELTTPLPENSLLHYTFTLLDGSDNPVFELTEDEPSITYEGESLPSFAIKPKINQVYHGSCGKTMKKKQQV